MRTAILTDLHGVSPLATVSALVREGVGRFAFLGDYDTPALFDEVLNLRVPKLVLIGNHDHAFCSGEEIVSPNLIMPPEEYRRLWKHDEAAWRMVARLAKIRTGRKRGLKIVERVKVGHEERKIAYVHAALPRRDWDIDAVDALLWGRMLTDATLLMAFMFMKDRNYWILFRGHDHQPQVASVPWCSSPNTWVRKEHDAVVQLQPELRYIVTVGAFAEGFYAVFDDQTLQLERRHVAQV